jgi:hypothetical protein
MLFEQLLPSHLLVSFPVLEKLEIYLDSEWWKPGEHSGLNQFDLPSIRMLCLSGNAATQEVSCWRKDLTIPFISPLGRAIVMPPEVSLCHQTSCPLAQSVYIGCQDA